MNSTDKKHAIILREGFWFLRYCTQSGTVADFALYYQGGEEGAIRRACERFHVKREAIQTQAEQSAAEAAKGRECRERIAAITGERD
jgi:hypothetical protein